MLDDNLVKLENIIQSTTVLRIVSTIYKPIIDNITMVRVDVWECGKTSSSKIIVSSGEINPRILKIKITTAE
jgi:hypothetical protein